MVRASRIGGSRPRAPGSAAAGSACTGVIVAAGSACTGVIAHARATAMTSPRAHPRDSDSVIAGAARPARALPCPARALPRRQKPANSPQRPPQDVARLRKIVDSLRLPRQRRIHFTAESDARRKTILVALSDAGAKATVYDASSYTNVKLARDAALTRRVDDSAKIGAELLVIERDDQSEASDKAIIRARADLAGCRDTLRYGHKRAHEECLLSIPDAVAWSWTKGGHWRQRLNRIVTNVVRV